MGIFSKIFNGLKKTKDGIGNKLSMIFGAGELDDEFFEELEYVLISSDIGSQTANDIIEKVKKEAKKEHIKTIDGFKELLRNAMKEILSVEETPETYPEVILVIGVNGVGKTTSIGKMTHYYKSIKKDVVMVAGDTFRAAASEQLTEWANRNNVRIIKQAEGADSASVVFDGIQSAKSKNTDVLLIDTAGRLHNKANLMEELKKINRIVEREWPEANYKKYIVLDATTGQNALTQVEYFNEAVGIDGIILTKLDGTSKGGVVLSIINEYKVPIKFIGVGEGIDDLMPFNSEAFVKSII